MIESEKESCDCVGRFVWVGCVFGVWGGKIERARDLSVRVGGVWCSV